MTSQFAVLLSCVVALFTTQSAAAQEAVDGKSEQKKVSWQDLGFNQVPKGFSTDQLALFQGLNAARGTWSMSGEAQEGKTASAFQGTLQVQGHPQAGMIPMWYLNCKVDGSEQVTSYVLMAGPGKERFQLSLMRMGPALPTAKDKASIPRSLFEGKWNLASSTVSWVEKAPPKFPGSKPSRARDSDAPKESFELLVEPNGRIAIRNSKNVPQGAFVSVRAIKKTAEAPKQPTVLTGEHSFQSVAEIDDPRIEPWIPPQATEISLVCDRGGHLARYKIKGDDFLKFVDSLWSKPKDSAHKRDHMSGEGEPINSEKMAARFKRAGWEPLENATSYYGPSQSNGAITTYYFDREAGIAYHDRGYW